MRCRRRWWRSIRRNDGSCTQSSSFPTACTSSDFYLDDKECLEDAAGSLKWLERADLGSDFQLYYLVDEQEDERVGALLRHAMENGGGMAGLAGTDPRTLGRAYGYCLAMIDYPWRALQMGADPAVAEKVSSLPAADQPKLEARTLTPHGHRVFSFFQNTDAWHLYLDVVTPMFNEQSVTAVAHKFVDRAHEVSCDAIVEPHGEPAEPMSYWEPPGFVSPMNESERFTNTGH